MIDSTHINTTKDSIKKFKKMITPQVQEKPEDIIKFYVDNYPEVELVTCGKCKTPMCLWVFDPAKAMQMQQMHHKGHTRITLSPKLLSTRKRLDGYHGYWCACGNDSRLANAEKGIVPEMFFDENGDAINPEISLDVAPHHEAAVKILLAQKGNKTNVKEASGKITIDNFIHERLK